MDQSGPVGRTATGRRAFTLAERPQSDVNTKEPDHSRHGWTWQYCPTGIHEISLRTGGVGNGRAVIS